MAGSTTVKLKKVTWSGKYHHKRGLSRKPHKKKKLKKNLGVICMKLINPSRQRYDQRRQMSRKNPPEQKNYSGCEWLMAFSSRGLTDVEQRIGRMERRVCIKKKATVAD